MAHVSLVLVQAIPEEPREARPEEPPGERMAALRAVPQVELREVLQEVLQEAPALENRRVEPPEAPALAKQVASQTPIVIRPIVVHVFTVASVLVRSQN